MSQLKTLKDLNLGYEGYKPEDENIRQQLRQEAKKWVNHILWNGEPYEAEPFIKFFNLTEEDLQ